MRTLGLDLGGSKLLACIFDTQMGVLGQRMLPTGRQTCPDRALELIDDAARDLIQIYGPIEAIGLGISGLVDFRHGLVRSSVGLDGWCNEPLRPRLEQRFQVRCVVDNDVNTAALSELYQRRTYVPEGMLFVSLGTTIGGALALGGRLWRGANGVAGALGEMVIAWHGDVCGCGRRGCLNTLASGEAIERRAGIEPGSLALRVGEGHPGAVRALEQAVDALAVGIGNLLNLLNPDLVVLGGGIAQLGEPLRESLSRRARAEAFVEARGCRIELARAGYEAGAVGAALLAVEAISPQHHTF